MKELSILVLLFFCYSFFGWIMEVIVGLFQHHKFINRGFLIGPICPIYGVGGLLIYLLLNKYSDDPLALFFMAIILCAVLEYFTSYLMEKIFKNRWWDYSDMKFNINGRICLECAIPFGMLGLLIFYIINPPLISFFSIFGNKFLIIFTIILLIITVIDIGLSFNIILKLKNISNSVKCDSTEVITKKVKDILLHSNIFQRRLLESFPNMKVFNKMSLLKQKLNDTKNKLKKEKKK